MAFGNKAKKAAPKATELPKITEPTFKVIVSADLGSFKAKQELTEDRHIAAYFRLVMNEGEETKTKLTDAQIVSGIKHVDVSELSVEESEETRVNYLRSIESSEAAPKVDMRAIYSVSVLADEARKEGEKADAGLAKIVDKAIEGKKDYDGAPIVIVPQLVRIYGEDDMATWPIMGSRKYNDNKDTVPANYNGPTDYFLVGNADKPKQRWRDIFVENMPHVRGMIIRRDYLRILVGKEGVKGLPANAVIPVDWKKYIGEDGTVVTEHMQAKLDDVVADIASNKERIGRAIAYWQQGKAFAAAKDCDVKFTLIDATPEATAKRKKPIVPVVTGKTLTGDAFTSNQKPIPLSTFLRFNIAKARKLSGNGRVTWEALKKSGQKTKTPAGQTSTDTKAILVENVDRFGDLCSSLFEYLEKHSAAIGSALKDPKKAGLIANRMDYLDRALRSQLDDTTMALSKDYDDSERQANLAARKAEKEQKAA